MTPKYTDATAITAEGARIGIVTCCRCGAAILLDPRAEWSAIEKHDEWHATQDYQFSAMESEVVRATMEDQP